MVYSQWQDGQVKQAGQPQLQSDGRLHHKPTVQDYFVLPV
jgi:hypothetical protein